MGETFNMHEAKTQLSKLVERALKGEEIVIAKNGEPVVRLDPVHPLDNKRAPVFGRLSGKVTIPDSFNRPLPREIQSYFEGESGPEDDF